MDNQKLKLNILLFFGGVLSVTTFLFLFTRKRAQKKKQEPQSSLIISPKFQETETLIQLLYTVAEEQSKKEGFVHRGITCNNCATSPIKGFRFKCTNCIDYDICENCEAEGVHFSTHVFVKIKIPIPPLANPRSALLNLFYPGKLESLEEREDFELQTHFEEVEIQALFEQYKSLSIDVNGIDQQTFEQCLGPLGIERNLITERIFNFFDQDNDGYINFPELVTGLSILCKGSLEEKIIYAFRGYDLDNDGYISKDELRKMFRAYFYLSMELVRDVVRALEEEIIEGFDEESNKPVSAAFTAPIPTHSGSGVVEVGQEAVEEMVEKTFSVVTNGKDMIGFEEFREFVRKDGSMIAWFEALGSVF